MKKPDYDFVFVLTYIQHFLPILQNTKFASRVRIHSLMAVIKNEIEHAGAKYGLKRIFWWPDF